MQRQDLPLVLGWRNHPDVRKYMHTQHEISVTEHEEWFGRASVDPKLQLLIYEDRGMPLGFMSLKVNSGGDTVEWGFYKAPGSKKGTGKILGTLALNYAFEYLNTDAVYGHVLSYNTPSINFHKRLGFVRVTSITMPSAANHDTEVIVFKLLKSEWMHGYTKGINASKEWEEKP